MAFCRVRDGETYCPWCWGEIPHEASEGVYRNRSRRRRREREQTAEQMAEYRHMETAKALIATLDTNRQETRA